MTQDLDRGSQAATPNGRRDLAGGPRERSSPRWPVFLFSLALASHAILNGLSVRITWQEQAAFAAMILTSTLLAIIRGAEIPRSPVSPVITIWSIYMSIHLLAVLVKEPTTSVTQALTDFAVMILPLLVYGVARNWFGDGRYVMWILTIYLMSGVVGGVLGFLLKPTGERIEAPSILMLSIAWCLAVGGAKSSARRPHLLVLTGVAALAALVPLVVVSRSRTALGALVVVGLLAMWIRRTPTKAWLIALLLLFGLAWGTQSGSNADDRLDALVEQARLSTPSGESVHGVSYRWNEASDALSTYQSGNFLELIVGQGHGATFHPAHGTVMTKADDAGRVHHVHFTPAMLLLRYGILGLLAYLMLVVAAITASFRVVRTSPQFPIMVAASALPVYVIDSLVRNSFVDPGLSLVLAVALAGGGKKGKS